MRYGICGQGACPRPARGPERAAGVTCWSGGLMIIGSGIHSVQLTLGVSTNGVARLGITC